MTSRRIEIRPLAIATLVLVLATTPVASARSPADSATARERPAAVAGAFYPADAGRLRAAVDAYLTEALPPRGERPVALVVPHAGYLYSGQIAADAYRQAAGFDYDVVVVLGTNHTVAQFDGVSVYQGSGYRTPLGLAPLDIALAKALLGTAGLVRFDPAAHAREHSEEVQVPFVQVVFPKARLVTAVVPGSDLRLATRFGEALGRAIAGRRALLVASSDLSHYPAHEAATAADRRTLDAIASLDPRAAAAAFAREQRIGTPGLATAACGQGAILAAMVTARTLGARRGEVVSYANSGDTTAGELDRVVGYGAVAFFSSPAASRSTAFAPPSAPAEVSPPAGPLTAEERSTLLALARQTLERYYQTGTLPLPRPASPALGRARGAFVTLSKRGELRGCIGHMAEDTPLALVVAKMALAAALEDRRFPPIRGEELAEVEIEVSALTPFARIAGAPAVVVGRDGVLLAKAGHRAVFLPQVATEQGWNRDRMLDELCLKAGLEIGCWRAGAMLSTFQAEVFGEKGTR